MYYVTYKNILRSDKKRIDYEKWLNKVWPAQQQWGARNFKIWDSWDENPNVIYCQYEIDDLDRWNESALHPQSEAMISALSRIVDINRMSINIKLGGCENA